jgi:transposase
MTYFAGLDVSVKETSVCIVDDAGKIVREARVASEPEALLQVLTNTFYRLKRVGLEAGPLSQWLYSSLAEAGLPVICVETRHMRAMLKAQINKTDRNDARGIAQMMRAGLYRPVHVKTLRSQKLRVLLTHRKLLQSKAPAIITQCEFLLWQLGGPQWFFQSDFVPQRHCGDLRSKRGRDVGWIEAVERELQVAHQAASHRGTG